MSAEIDDLALRTPCPSCGVQPPFWCVTYRPTMREPGYLTSYLHSTRTEPIREGWRLGLREGISAALNSAATELEHARTGYRWARPDTPVLPSDEVAKWLERRAEKGLW